MTKKMTQDEYKAQLLEYHKQDPEAEIYISPQLNDSLYCIDGHYYYMGIWAFEKIVKRKPKIHIDFGGDCNWIGCLGTVIKTISYDIRKNDIQDYRVDWLAGDVINTGFKDNSIDSLSCLHVAEHIGLGRYGDQIDPKGTEKACKELARILKPGGRLYFAVPVGKECVVFNSHRVIDPEKILEYFKGLKLLELSASHTFTKEEIEKEYKPTDYIRNVKINKLTESHYACGMYLFGKE